ncbi:MAG TPA: DNA alkylation repair protein [Anaerolineales bacterium]|nr:DNA alkylation repair protein [Anaerolineales bacterium]
MTSAQDVISTLQSKARPDQLAGMKRYGMNVINRLGIAIPELRKIARQIDGNHELALELWQTGVAEARILASMIASPTELSGTQMDAWAADFDSWDVCDQVCMNLFEKSPLAWEKVVVWSSREEEFVRRAAYALLACLAWHDKKAPDGDFIRLIPVIRASEEDERKMVAKAVSWALRNIGKRNPHLHQVAMQTASEMLSSPSKSARWIGSDALRDLHSEATQRRLAKMQSKDIHLL